jgi:hypothetical protein
MPDLSSTSCNCGPLKPQADEKPIKEGSTPEQIMAEVQLNCDDETGVFFFRYNQQFYMRTVKSSESENNHL